MTWLDGNTDCNDLCATLAARPAQSRLTGRRSVLPAAILRPELLLNLHWPASFPTWQWQCLQKYQWSGKQCWRAQPRDSGTVLTFLICCLYTEIFELIDFHNPLSNTGHPLCIIRPFVRWWRGDYHFFKGKNREGNAGNRNVLVGRWRWETCFIRQQPRQIVLSAEPFFVNKSPVCSMLVTGHSMDTVTTHTSSRFSLLTWSIVNTIPRCDSVIVTRPQLKYNIAPQVISSRLIVFWLVHSSFCWTITSSAKLFRHETWIFLHLQLYISMY